jgi:hypothetical protein
MCFVPTPREVSTACSRFLLACARRVFSFTLMIDTVLFTLGARPASIEMGSFAWKLAVTHKQGGMREKLSIL